MVEKYKCGNIECEAHGIAIPDVRTLRSADGRGRVCGVCGKPMKVAETINVSQKRRAAGRSRQRRTPKRY